MRVHAIVPEALAAAVLVLVALVWLLLRNRRGMTPRDDRMASRSLSGRSYFSTDTAVASFCTLLPTMVSLAVATTSLVVSTDTTRRSYAFDARSRAYTQFFTLADDVHLPGTLALLAGDVPPSENAVAQARHLGGESLHHTLYTRHDLVTWGAESTRLVQAISVVNFYADDATNAAAIRVLDLEADLGDWLPRSSERPSHPKTRAKLDRLRLAWTKYQAGIDAFENDAVRNLQIPK